MSSYFNDNDFNFIPKFHYIFTLYFLLVEFYFFFRDKRVYDMVANKNFIEIKTINRERDKEKTFLRFDGILEKLTEYHNLRFLLNENKNIFT